MKIEEGAIVSIDYKLFSDDGSLLESTDGKDPLIFIFGHDMVISGLEKGLEGMEPGETKRITVEPEDGYGPVDHNLIQSISRERFPKDFEVEVGGAYRAETDSGRSIFFRVTKIDAENVEIDMNHPLAGKTLHFEVTVREVRNFDGQV